MPGPGETVGPAAYRWHRELEGEGDYAESWYYLVQTDAGGLLVVCVSITNLGLRTFDATVDGHFYGVGREPIGIHREYRRSDIVSLMSGREIRVGPNRLGRHGDRFYLSLREGNWKLDLDISGRFGSAQEGDGKLRFGDSPASGFLAVGMSVPRGASSGTLRVGKAEVGLSGSGYHGHSWSTIKLVSVLTGWSALWLMDPDLSLVLHQQVMEDELGGAVVSSGFVAMGETVIGGGKQLSMRPTEWEVEPASGYRVPRAWRLGGQSNGYRIDGTLERRELLHSIDLLGILSWPVRTVVQAIYGSPYTMRYRLSYDLLVRDPNGKQSRLTGIAPFEASYYRQPTKTRTAKIDEQSRR